MIADYSRKVSFDSFAPQIIPVTDDPIIYESAQYATQDDRKKCTKHGLDLNYGFDTPRTTDVSKVLDAFHQINTSSTNSTPRAKSKYKRKKVPKLPPPPEKSILKRSEERNYTHESEEQHDPDSPSLIPASSVTLFQPKKRSLVGLSDEELLAMDAQFRKGVDPETLKFDGDGYLPMLHNASGLTASEAKRASHIKHIDKFVGSMVKDQKNDASLANFSSYSTTYRHNDMTKYIKEQLSGCTEEYPSSLRDTVVYISGRRHTWVALDWALNQFIRDGDNLVVVCQIPEAVATDPLKKNSSWGGGVDEDPLESDDDDLGPPSYEYVDVEAHYGPDGIQNHADRLAKYIFKRMDDFGKDKLKISFTVELIKEKCVSTLLRKAIALYIPQTFICSSQVTHLIASTVTKNMKLPFFVTEKLRVPIIVVPVRLVGKDTLWPDSKKEDDAMTMNTGISIEVTEHDPKEYLAKLNEFVDSLDPMEGEDFVISFPSSRSDSRRGSTVSTTSAQTPEDYFGPPQSHIRFPDNLAVPRNNSSSSNSRRNSTGTGIYKVKSLLDSEPYPDPAPRSKSYSSPVTRSVSNNLEKSTSRHSNFGNAIKKVRSEPPQEKKAGFFGSLFRKKKT